MMDAEVRREVITRDGGCLAPLLGAPGYCRGKTGTATERFDVNACEVDYLGTRMRPGHAAERHANPAQLATICAGHHRGGGDAAGQTRQWSTGKDARRKLRRYVWARVCGLDLTDAIAEGNAA